MMRRPRNRTRMAGFTLVEVILVVVIIAIISGIALPYYAGTLHNMKLKTSARTINRAALYARGQAILRETVMRIEIDREQMEIRLSQVETATAATDTADRELDQSVLKRLGYIDDTNNGETSTAPAEFRKKFPERLILTNFEKKSGKNETDQFYQIDFYPNGQCDEFELEIQNDQGKRVKLKNDPITAKVSSEIY